MGKNDNKNLGFEFMWETLVNDDEYGSATAGRRIGRVVDHRLSTISHIIIIIVSHHLQLATS